MLIRFLLILIICIPANTYSQDKKSKRNKAVYELSKTLEEGESDLKLAESYEKAAKEQAEKGEYAKAEDFLNKAKQLYQKLKNTEKVASIDRELAKIQETQSRYDEAIANYNSASQLSKSSVNQALNVNDMQRVMNNSNPRIQKQLIQENIELLEKTNNKEDKVVAYQQMANVNLQLNNQKEAIGNLKDALKDTKEPTEKVKINRQLVDIYTESKDFDKAININQKLITDAQKNKDTKTEIEQLQSLSSIYLKKENEQEGISALQEAYDLAIGNGHTINAKKSLDLLVQQYQKKGDTKKVMNLYNDFMDRLETLIKSDSSLIDSKLFQVNEEKISQLEKERALKDELIRKKNNLNYILIGSIILITLFLLLIAISFFSIKKKNKRIALQSLRREMNPHFLFNSLNSVNQFIAQNNELEANKYLSSYSKLMRNIMENSNKDFIPLSTELEQIREYLELEHLRFCDKFDYHIQVDKSLDIDSTLIPNMLIQPQIENAIWHGLRYKKEKGLLLLDIYPENNQLVIKIEDNGIGIRKSEELKTKNQKAHQSRGLKNTRERVELLNNLYNAKINLEIQEKEGESTGVIVLIKSTLNRTNIHE
ncbi:MAG: histidine kinase [Dysgonomonas sp.]|nr:histidine kinase [Dysgonomonas sp.]